MTGSRATGKGTVLSADHDRPVRGNAQVAPGQRDLAGGPAGLEIGVGIGRLAKPDADRSPAGTKEQPRRFLFIEGVGRILQGVFGELSTRLEGDIAAARNRSRHGHVPARDHGDIVIGRHRAADLIGGTLARGSGGLVEEAASAHLPDARRTDWRWKAGNR